MQSRQCVLAMLALVVLATAAAGAGPCPSCQGGVGDYYGYAGFWGYAAYAAPACGAPAYGSLVPGCCELPPSRCQHVWDGYCEQRAYRGCGFGARVAYPCASCPCGGFTCEGPEPACGDLEPGTGTSGSAELPVQEPTPAEPAPAPPEAPKQPAPPEAPEAPAAPATQAAPAAK